MREEGTMKKLGELSAGNKGRIVSVGSGNKLDERENEIVRRLLQMGMTEGASFVVALEAPWSRDPIAVSVRGALIALRRAEANLVEVELLQSEAS
jgi:Fe2+ transport system protein FeoA